MSTKDYCLSLNNKKNVVVLDDHGSFDNHKNLNLNQRQCSNVMPVISKSNPIDNKKATNYDFTHNNDLQAKAKSNLWSKSNNQLSSKHFNVDSAVKSDKSNKKSDLKNSNSNSSTLSLHIAAYENAVEGVVDGDGGGNEECEKKSVIKKWKNKNQSSSIIQDSFEFPRQLEDDKSSNNDPEIAQFKASQKLFNPNESNVSMQANMKFNGDQYYESSDDDDMPVMKKMKLNTKEEEDQATKIEEESESEMPPDLSKETYDSALLDSSDMSAEECEDCEDCSKMEKAIEILEKKIEEIEDMSESQKIYCEMLEERIDDEEVFYQRMVEECRELQIQHDTYLARSGKETSEKLPTFEEARINELTNHLAQVQAKRDIFYNEWEKEYNEYLYELNHCDALNEEHDLLKAEADEQKFDHEDFKEHFLGQLLQYTKDIKEQSAKISKLKSTFSNVSDIFKEILDHPNASSPENDKLKQEIQQFLDAHPDKTKQ